MNAAVEQKAASEGVLDRPDGRSNQRRRRWTLVAASLGFAVIQLDVSVVNVAFTPIGVALGGGVAGSQWIVAAYTVAFAALILTAGALGDRELAGRCRPAHWWVAC